MTHYILQFQKASQRKSSKSHITSYNFRKQIRGKAQNHTSHPTIAESKSEENPENKYYILQCKKASQRKISKTHITSYNARKQIRGKSQNHASHPTISESKSEENPEVIKAA
jgi:hypothetical protein